MPLPLLAAAGIAAAATAAGAGLGAAAGVGKNAFRASNFGDTSQYSPAAFSYGGGADATANRYRGLAEGAQNRAGTQVDYGQANVDRGLGMQARGGQSDMASLMSNRARGLVPSIAEMQADRQMQQATAAQSSAAASARGAGGMALAQQNAANNTATMQGAISNQAQINAAQERMQAEQAAFGAYSGMRGGDLQSQGQSAQQSQYQAQLEAQQRAQNDAMTMGMTGYETGVRNSELNAGIQQQGMLSQSHTAADQMNMGVNQANANNSFNMMKMAMGGVQGGADAMAGGGLAKRAAGGPVAAGQPYLVGELGPELVVPHSNGMVIPSRQTMGLLGAGAGAGGMMRGGLY